MELATLEISIIVFKLMLKIFNIPLLNVTTLFVAKDASNNSSSVDTKSQESKSTSLLSANCGILTIKHLIFISSSKFHMYTEGELMVLLFSLIV